MNIALNRDEFKLDRTIGSREEINQYLLLKIDGCLHSWIKFDDEPYQQTYICIKCNKMVTGSEKENDYDLFTPKGFFKLWKWLNYKEEIKEYKLFGKYINQDFVDYEDFPRVIACYFLVKDKCKNCLEGIETQCCRKLY
jgi:hypothetical protein